MGKLRSILAVALSVLLVVVLLPANVFAEDDVYSKNLTVTADKYGMAEIAMIKGDLDGNGLLSETDELIILDHVNKIIELSPELMDVADIDYNGLIQASDYGVVMRIRKGTVTNHPIYMVKDIPNSDYEVDTITYEGEVLQLPTNFGESKVTQVNGADITVVLNEDNSVDVSGIWCGVNGVGQTIHFTHKTTKADEKNTENENNQNTKNENDQDTDGTDNGNGTETGTENKDKQNDSVQTTSPKTSDNKSILLSGSLLLISSMLLLFRKRIWKFYS